MKKILILGASGMLGHKAYQILSRDFDTYGTFQNFNTRQNQTGLYNENNIIDKIDAFDFQSVKKVIDKIKPDVIINCIGIIKQLKKATNPKISIYINSLFPHLVEEACRERNCKLIHISTDCVFSGKRGDYTEYDISDAEDLYGKTKFLGEVFQSKYALTLRTSIIGRELFTASGLVEWFLSQDHKTVKGFVNAIYTGLTTNALCKEIGRIIHGYQNLSGLFHVSSNKISKHSLLELIKSILRLDIQIVPYEEFRCDRSLDSTRYRSATNFVPPSWEEMIQEMFQDPTHYNSWRGK
jgi:dTDP-4-dehydrorhamnose reductase